MSHFTVLVIGPEVEAQLAPYDENTSVPEYASEDVSEEDKQSFLEHYRKEHPEYDAVPFERMYIAFGKDWNGMAWRLDGDGIWRNYSTYNPKSKWDWYEIGGRWQGFFKVKPGRVGARLGRRSLLVEGEAERGTADILTKGMVDIVAMRDAKGQEAAEEWDAFHEIVAGRNYPLWPDVCAKHGEDIDAARKEYHEHPVIRDLQATERFKWCWDNEFERLSVPREAYIQAARDGAIVPFAFVKDGEWHERGDMGWWGFVSDEKDRDVWNAEFSKMFDALPDDTPLTLVDCHI